MNQWKFLPRVPFAVLICLFSVVVAASDHARLEVGQSFLLEQVIERNGKRVGMYTPRLDAFARNNVGRLLLEIDSGPKGAESDGRITKIMYTINSDACVVDVLNGLALRTGTDCIDRL